MGSFTPISKSQASTLLASYGLSNIHQLEPLLSGTSNSNYKVSLETGGSYLLKISNDKTKKELVEEFELLNAIAKRGFPYVLLPLTQINSAEFLIPFQDQWGEVFPFIQGQHPPLNPRFSFLQGQVMARLHLLSLSGAWSKIREYTEIGQPPSSLTSPRSLATCPAEFRDFLGQKRAHQLMVEFQSQAFPEGLIHGDLFYDNFIFDGETPKAILDFEQAGIGPFLWDIGIGICGSCLEGNILSPPMAYKLLEGYESIRPLSPLEKKFFPHAVLFGCLSIARWRIKRFIENPITSGKEKSFLPLIERARIWLEKGTWS